MPATVGIESGQRIGPLVLGLACSKHTEHHRLVAITNSHPDRRIFRIASPEMLPAVDPLPHLICSRPVLTGGGGHEADQHDDA